MNILITGKNGYIAKMLINELSTYHSITSIGRDDFDLTNSDKTNKFFKFKNIIYDVVIHTAITGGNRLESDTTNIYNDNLKMFYNLINNKEYFNKIISFGSGAEVFKIDTNYGISKMLINNKIHELDYAYNIRLYGLFDNNELDRRFIKSALTNYINKKDIIINEDIYFDFYYASDFLKIVNYYITNNTPPKEIDCVYKDKYKLSDIATMINDLDNYNVNIKIDKPFNSKNNYIGKFTKLPIKLNEDIKYGIIDTYNKLLNYE